MLPDAAALTAALIALPPEIPDPRTAQVALLSTALESGRAAILTIVERAPRDGLAAAVAQTRLTDAIVTSAFAFATQRLYPLGNPSASERLALVALGGYGREEMAPFSDVDLMFLCPWKRTGWSEQVIEAVLYTLWDLGLKVGHSTRSPDEIVREARADLSVRTALLEQRFLTGDRALYEEGVQRFDSDVLIGTERSFVTGKLAEREARHQRLGDSRYVVEPNLKEGKGGLRDLQTLFWIGKYLHRVPNVSDLVAKGLLTSSERHRFAEAETFLWAVRFQLHLITGRAEERLTFDVQPEIARRLGYADRPGRSGVERFMRHYFLMAKRVGDLTGVFLAHLDDRLAQKGRRFGLAGLIRRPRKLSGFVLDRGRLALPSRGVFVEDPARLLEIFAIAEANGLEIHPRAMKAIMRDARLIDGQLRADPRANDFFMQVLTGRRDPEKVLRWMNEAGVMGRFLPDFGRVVARMQFDMYHHYTVDEHSLRAVGLLSQIERGLLRDDHPIATALIGQIASRRTLYVAVLLHDIAKGRGGDHSVLGAEVAERLCPRLGLTPGETEDVIWLVRYHLLMAATAFKRDLADPQTISHFVAGVQTLERLRLLLILTIADIRAVGPKVWNDWKRQLLGSLYTSAEELLRLGHMGHGRAERVAARQAALGGAMGWPHAECDAYGARLPEAYWIAEPEDVILANARLVSRAGEAPLTVEMHVDADRGATRVTVYAADHAGLFYRLVGAITLAGASIIDARIHTTRDGMALDNFLVQGADGAPITDPSRLARLKTEIETSLSRSNRVPERLAQRPLAHPRAGAFPIDARIAFDNRASRRYTVVEATARDRPALLHALARALFDGRAMIRSAHIATYGERAVDTFYVTDLTGAKIEGEARLKALEQRLLNAIESG